MLFIVMHKTDLAMEAGVRPEQRIITEMGQLIGAIIEQGQFRNAAGLKRSAERVRLRFRGGHREVIQGPLQGENELTAGFAMLKVASMDEAVAWTTRMAEIEGSQELEFDIGPVVEGWDIALTPKPEDAPLRVLALRKADTHSEAGAQPSSEMMSRMQALMATMKEAGVLLAAEGLKPSAQGKRLTAKAGKHTWVDGPFAESKELIAGFTMLDVPSWHDVQAFTTRYADILGDVEVDVREVYG